jgi:coiled-coil domain-containing protein 40
MSDDHQMMPVASLSDDDGDDTNENPIELIQEFGTHRLMQRVQRALTKQLKQTHYRLQVELLEKEEELKRVTQDRELIGVQLYGIQQQLAKVQISLENAHLEYNGLVENRIREEEMQSEVAQSNGGKQALLSEYKKQHKKYSSELESLYETIQQIEKYNEEVKSEIAITRRAAYKTEQSLQHMEKHKESQDFYVDALNKQIKSLQAQISLYSDQYDSQRVETAEAKAVLQDTARELDLIANEKKQLMIQWKSALSGLSRRDEALAQAGATLSSAESAVHDYDVEIDASKRDIQREQARHETLVNIRDRLENELQWVEENLTKIKAEREQLQERYTLLSKSLSQTDAEAKKLDAVSKQLSTDSESVLQSWQIVTQERQQLEDEVQTMHSTHQNVNKAVDNLGKDQAKLLKRIHERENEANEIQNEIARTKVDRLNASALNDQLKEQHGTVTKELRDKEALISKYHVEIRQRNDDIEKKMYRVDRLNKKYEKMVESAGGEENLGPMENTVKTLNKETEALREECKELERDWLRRQTDLVGVASEVEELNELNNELQARVTILGQQQLRYTKDLRKVKSDVKVANQTNIDLQKDVTKLNALINQNHDQEGSLQHANFVLERGCVDELKDMEKECAVLQTSISSMKEAKAKLIDEIMDMERQALLWEKKIQLDKETREALDPSVGQQEVQNMEKEIHRMSIRYDALKREQERLAGEMERAIYKRSAIENRYKSKTASASAATSKGGGMVTQDLTQAAIKKRIGQLKRDARSLADETLHYSSAIDDKKSQLQSMTAELEHVTARYADTEDGNAQVQADINELLYNKQLNQENISYRQKYCKRLRELSQSGIDLSQSLQIERRLLSAQQAVENVKEIISDLRKTFPHLDEVLFRVQAMANPGFDFSDLVTAQ